MSVKYIWPDHYPKNCPPKPLEEKPGIYFRLTKNSDKLDPRHFKSHYELGLQIQMEKTKACSRRAISMNSKYYDAVMLYKQLSNLGKYIATLDLKDGCGVVKETNKKKSHHDWWVPEGIAASNYCIEIKAIE